MSHLPTKRFDKSATLDGPRPSPSWLPSPEQIRQWCRQIRAENGTLPQVDEPQAEDEQPDLSAMRQPTTHQIEVV